MEETNFFIKELSCYGEILEGFLYSSTNYGDVGELFLDHLDFHKRIDDPSLILDAKNQELIIKYSNPEIIAKYLIFKYKTMFRPLHYCNAEKFHV